MYGENCPRKAFMRILCGDTMRRHSDWLWKKQAFNQNTHAIQMRAYSNGRRLIVFGCMKDPVHTRRDPYTLFRHGKWEIPHVRIGLMCMQSKRKGSKTRNQTTIRIFPFDRERSRNHLRWAPKPPKEKSVPIFEPASESSEIHYTLNVEWETIYIGTPCRGFGFSFFFHSSDVESFVTCLKFTKRKPNQLQGKSTMCLTFYSCWGFYLSSSPSRRWFGWEYTAAAAANSRQTAIYGNGMHLFCCHCFAHHYTFSIVIRA